MQNQKITMQTLLKRSPFVIADFGKHYSLLDLIPTPTSNPWSLARNLEALSEIFRSPPDGENRACNGEEPQASGKSAL